MAEITSVLNLLVIITVTFFAYKWGSSKIPDPLDPSINDPNTGKITLHYFDARWTTEAIRLLLKYGGINFEDNRIKENWPELKPKTPFGHLPVIERNGQMAAQSIAIARYIAKKVHLTGANDWEDLEIDSVVDTLNDIKEKISKLFGEENEEAKKKLQQTHLQETLPYYFEKLDKRAAENNGYLVGKKLTWADFYFVVAYDAYTGLLGAEIIEKYPNLVKVRKNVLELPPVKAWIESRPKTPF